jgi:hypothetical protein
MANPESTKGLGSDKALKIFWVQGASALSDEKEMKIA